MFFKPLPSKPSFFTRALRAGLAGLGAVAAMAATSAGCLDRPVAPATPNTSNVFIDQIRQTGVDKIDLLLMIDNSLSMADKQDILAEAVPLSSVAWSRPSPTPPPASPSSRRSTTSTSAS
jgi:hypothetical protein